MGDEHHGDAAAYGDDQGRDFRGSDFGVRQLRGGFGDGSLRSAASLRAQPVGTDHSAGVETHEVVGIVLLLRDVLARSLFAKYQTDFKKLNRILDAYEPAANRIANTVAVGFVQERERVIRQQQEAIRELSTPVLQVRERLLILPIIGVIDVQRARQLTKQLLRGIRTNRAKVVVIDITGVAAMDLTVANHLVQTVEASRLLGATVIVTGLSPEIAQTLVTIGVDLGKMNTVGDLQGGIEQAERLLGYKVVLVADTVQS